MKGDVEYCANEIWQAGLFWQKHLGLIRDNEPKVHTSSSDDKAIHANVIYPQTLTLKSDLHYQNFLSNLLRASKLLKFKNLPDRS